MEGKWANVDCEEYKRANMEYRRVNVVYRWTDCEEVNVDDFWTGFPVEFQWK